MDKIFEIATNVSTPLMLAGFLAAAFFFVARQIIKANIFPQLTRQLSGDIIKIIIERLFMLSLIAMVLGFVGYIYEKSRSNTVVPGETKEHYEAPAFDLIRLSLSDISAVNLLPRPEMKNLTLAFKVIPKSRDKFVPLKSKGELIVIDSLGNETRYVFDANFDDVGIRPEVPSSLILDGLLPKSEYGKIIASNSYRAKCVLYYDSDIVRTDVKFISEIFPFNNSTITDHSN